MKSFKGTKGNWSICNGGRCIVFTEKLKRHRYDEYDYDVDVKMARDYLVPFEYTFTVLV